MDSKAGSGPFDNGDLSEQDRRTLVTLERAIRKRRSRSFRSAWTSLCLRLLPVWGPRLLARSGTAVILLGLAATWFGLATTLWLAFIGEGLLVAGSLLAATGAQMGWRNRHAHSA